MFSGRGFNIDTLNVAPTLDPSMSRMTIVVRGDDKTLDQVVKQTEKLVDVIKVDNFRDDEFVDRELVLMRVDVTPQTRSEVLQICDVFRAKIVDVKVIIGLYPGSKSRAVAKKKGFAVFNTADAVKQADIIFVAVPDTKIAAVYEKDIAPHLTKGKTLLFSHGFAIHFKTITPPKNIDVIMVAPKGPGHIVRRQFTEGQGVPTLIAVYQNPSKQAKKIALAWAKGISDTAKWGDVHVGPKIIDAGTKKRMKGVLKEIQTGKFAREWIAEDKKGRKKYSALLKKGEKHGIEKTGIRLRSLMPWIKKRNLKGAQASYA
jgi:ketol-acid reductoisomerase